MIRPVLHEDVTSAARALLAEQQQHRPRLCAAIFAQAATARRYVDQNQHLHPQFGNGSLMAAARCYVLADEPTFDNPDYCHCVMQVMAMLCAVSKGGSDSHPS